MKKKYHIKLFCTIAYRPNRIKRIYGMGLDICIILSWPSVVVYARNVCDVAGVFPFYIKLFVSWASSTRFELYKVQRMEMREYFVSRWTAPNS